LENNPFYRELKVKIASKALQMTRGLMECEQDGDGVGTVLAQQQTIGELRGLMFPQHLHDSIIKELETHIQDEEKS
jgi:hypothetical protein